VSWNPYDELGVAKDAGQDEIRRAYRARAKATHPDVDGGSEEAFAKVQLAYAILKDAVERKRFDETGEVKEQRVDNIRPTAVGLILSVFEKIVDDYTNSGFNEAINPERMDLMAVMKGQFTKEIAQAKSNIATGEASILMMKRLKGRFSNKVKNAPENPMVRALEMKCAAAEKQIENIRHGIKVRETCNAILDQYDFSFENLVMLTAGSTTATTGGVGTNFFRVF
jgi:curved DNA-binding protein CbpA